MKFSCVVAVLLVQVFTVRGDDIRLPFYNIKANSSSCMEISHMDSINHMSSTLTMANNMSVINLPFVNEGVNITNSAAMIGFASKQFDVGLVATLNKTSVNQTFHVSENKVQGWNNTGNGQGGFKRVLLSTTNFTSSGNTTNACMNVGLEYATGKGMTNVTVVSLGCWTWQSNLSTPLSYNVTTSAAIDKWAHDITKQMCSGSLTSFNTAPVLALLLAAVVSILNKH